MKKLLLTLSSSTLLLAPALANAAYDTPSKLITAVQEQGNRSFKMTTSGHSNGTYMSLWLSGASDAAPSKNVEESLKASGTLDIVHGDTKVRAKGDMLAVNGTAYVKLRSLTGNFENAFALFGFNGQQKKWFSLPLHEMRSELMTDALPMDLGSIDPTTADDIFTMLSTNGPAGTTYTLHLTTDSAVDLAMKIREFLGSNARVSTDFFPWRELAEGLRYELVIKTDANDAFVSSQLSVSTAGVDAAFSSTINEVALKSPMNIVAPKDAMNGEEVAKLLMESFDQSMEEDIPSDDADAMLEVSPSAPIVEPASATPESSSPADSVSCQTTDALELLSLQRAGVCKVMKTPTRYVR